MVKVPRGRLRRLGKLMRAGARVGADLASGPVKRLLGGDEAAATQAARRLIGTLGEMKGLALKAGQMLTLVGEQLPDDVRRVLARAFAQAPALGYEDIAEVIKSELGQRPEQLFAEFEPQSFAAASLGQVHAAKLR